MGFPSEVRLGDLSPTRQRLVRTAHHIGYGWLERLAVEVGEPRLGPPCRVFRTLKFTSPAEPPLPLAPTTALKAPWSELFAACDGMGTGEIERLEIQAGLPTRGVMEVTMLDSK